MSSIYWATAEVLIAAAQLGSGRDVPAPDRLRDDMRKLLHDMVARCRAAGIPDVQTAEARYAIVAFIDDCVLKSSWPGRSEWMNNPLQLQLYRESTAGENFFMRMRALLQSRSGDSDAALEVYYLCLALGFTGALPRTGAPQSAQSYVDAARERLIGGAPLRGPISPHGMPSQRYASRARRRPLVLGLVLGCAVVMILGLGALRWSTDETLARSAQGLKSVDPATTKTPAIGR